MRKIRKTAQGYITLVLFVSLGVLKNESKDASKQPPAASKHSDPDAAFDYFGNPELFDRAEVGTSKWPPDPDEVGTSKKPLDQTRSGPPSGRQTREQSGPSSGLLTRAAA